jgi:hypothetical protein
MSHPHPPSASHGGRDAFDLEGATHRLLQLLRLPQGSAAHAPLPPDLVEQLEEHMVDGRGDAPEPAVSPLLALCAVPGLADRVRAHPTPRGRF